MLIEYHVVSLCFIRVYILGLVDNLPPSRRQSQQLLQLSNPSLLLLQLLQKSLALNIGNWFMGAGRFWKVAFRVSFAEGRPFDFILAALDDILSVRLGWLGLRPAWLVPICFCGLKKRVLREVVGLFLYLLFVYRLLLGINICRRFGCFLLLILKVLSYLFI
jgi:hypothetical protein